MIRSAARRLGAPLAVLAGLAVLPASASAALFPGETIDGPSAEITSLGALDLARDATGAVVYTRRDGGIDHVFAARFADGAFTAPERLDGGLAAPASQPVVAASDEGRLAVAFISGGTLFATFRERGASTWTAPQAIADAASEPSIDMSINQVTYLAFTQGAGDVRVARAERKQTTFGLLPGTLDIEPARQAGVGTGRPKVAIAADGTGLVVWGEADRVFSRRVFDSRLSTSPKDLTLDALDGRPAGAADLPEVDAEDDSSYAWVTFRQKVQDGGTRTRLVARRLRGSRYEAPVAVDGLTTGGGPSVVSGRVELNGRGEGLVGAALSDGGIQGSALMFDAFTPAVMLLGGGGGGADPDAAVGENSDGMIAWRQADGVRARLFDDGRPAGTGVLSRPEDGGGIEGLDVAGDRAAGAVAVFLQGGGGARRLVAGLYDKPPGRATGYTTQRLPRVAQPRLRWQAAFDLWGPVRYAIEVDGARVAESTGTEVTLPAPLADGVHRWRIVATDRRGQTSASRTRLLRIDGTAPTVALRVSGARKARRPLTVTARARDLARAGARASGLKVVRIDFGDRSRPVAGTRARHAYRRPGRYTLTVSAQDRAGNVTTVERRLRIR